MAKISGSDILWFTSPRVFRIPQGTDEAVVFDIYDTVRDEEDEPKNLVYPELISIGGGEVLDSVTNVGFTITLDNGQIIFDEEPVPSSEGTVTNPDTNGLFLEDNTATFQTDGVVIGYWIINFRSRAVGTVLQVLSETRIQLLNGLSQGVADNEWQNGDPYRIWPIITKEVSGGNAVSVDTLGDPINVVVPSFGTQVNRTSASSATNQNSLDIEYASFNGGVSVDLTSIFSGTDFPVGTPRAPVNNFSDALSIANIRGFDILFINGNSTIDSGLDYSNFRIIGQSQNKTILTILSSANVSHTEFNSANIIGTLDGGSLLKNCLIGDLDFVDGFVENCVLNGTIILSGIAEAHIIDCSGSNLGVQPTIDMGGSGSALAMHNYNGDILLTNKSGSEPVVIDLNSGEVMIDSTVTNGDITIRGIGKLINNSTGSAVIHDEDFIQGATITQIDKRQTDTQYSLESLHSSPAKGLVWYWDPTSGSDSNSGTFPDKAVLTWAEAHARTVSGRGDVVYLVNTTGSSLVITERITISNNNVILRTMGSTATFTALDDTAPIITITGDNCGFNGGVVVTSAGTPQAAIYISGASAPTINNVQIVQSNGDGIIIENCSGAQVIKSFINSCSGNGVTLTNTALAAFREFVVSNNSGWGMQLIASSLGDTSNTFLDFLVAHNNTSGGVDIGTNVVSTTIMHTCFIEESSNQLIRLQNNGIDTNDVQYVREDRVGANTARIF
jgi:hypothetical protein